MAFPNLELGCLFQNILPGALTKKLFQAVSTVLWYLSFAELFQTLPGEFLGRNPLRLQRWQTFGDRCCSLLVMMGYVWIPPKICFLANAFVIIEDRQGAQLFGNVGLAIFTTLHPGSLVGRQLLCLWKLGHVLQHFLLSFG